jgi:hypothetical protein
LALKVRRPSTNPHLRGAERSAAETDGAIGPDEKETMSSGEPGSKRTLPNATIDQIRWIASPR